MSAAKHTPGPWGINGRSVGPDASNPMKFRGLATVAGFGDESDANLALVCAAPDLLAALQTITEHDQHNLSSAGVIARRAIAKARGEV